MRSDGAGVGRVGRVLECCEEAAGCLELTWYEGRRAFALTLNGAYSTYSFLSGSEGATSQCFETPEKEWTENLVQFVNEHGIAHFGEAFGGC